jgi:hypothetical protein
MGCRDFYVLVVSPAVDQNAWYLAPLRKRIHQLCASQEILVGNLKGNICVGVVDRAKAPFSI